MSIDITTLERFYASEIGKKYSQQINKSVSDLLPTASNLNIICFGAPYPLIDYINSYDHPIINCHLSAMGIHSQNHFPSFLSYESQLPLPSEHYNLAILIHWTEHCDYPLESLREIWRILVSGGHVMVVYPYKYALKRALKPTPSFSRTYIENLLADANFTPTETRPAVRGLPLGDTYYGATGAFKSVLDLFAEVQVSIGTKQLYAPTLDSPYTWRTATQT